MKRLITILCSICLCLMADAQIQTKFFGVEFSKQYESLVSARNLISLKCDYSEIYGNKIIGTQCHFGGHVWDIAHFKFHKESYNYVLYFVTFYSKHKKYHEAETKYKSLLQSLSNKYGTPASSSNEINDTFGLWANLQTRHSCMVSLLSREDEYGNEYWRVGLVYVDDQINDLVKQQEEDEL